jgi:hypothetical protein
MYYSFEDGKIRRHHDAFSYILSDPCSFVVGKKKIADIRI